MSACHRLQGAQKQFQVAEVLLDGLIDARVLNLDGDLFAIFKARPMDLAERRGGKRLAIEAGE